VKITYGCVASALSGIAAILKLPVKKKSKKDAYAQ
jgi:hypothetical protein